MNGRLGYDIEYAVKNNKGKIIPAGHLDTYGVKGMPEMLTNGGIEIDCCALEITPPPATDEDGFVSHILSLLEEVKKRYSDYKFLTKPSYTFKEKELEGIPHAYNMGCSADFNAWTRRENPKPNSPSGLRSFGGHVHIEGGDANTIRACDLTLGMWSVLKDKDTQRRKLYGKAGAFRYKPYGVEYRVLSNFWCDKEQLIRKVYKLTRLAQTFDARKVALVVSKFGGSRNIQRIINEGRGAEALKVFEEATHG